VVEPAEVLPTAKKQAETILSRAPLAVNYTKRSIEAGFDEKLMEAMKVEAHFFGQAFDSQDHIEGIQAFIAKRPAQFKGE
jgi:enoyl-CoA hydratase